MILYKVLQTEHDAAVLGLRVRIEVLARALELSWLAHLADRGGLAARMLLLFTNLASLLEVV